MKVRLTQIDGPLPNLALMRLAHWHRSRGDEVHFTRSPYKHLFEPEYDAVYGSAIFKYSAKRIETLRLNFPNAILGGTGTFEPTTVESILGEGKEVYDYSDYPKFTGSMGFTQRGCRLKCGFCVVPKKEGKARSVASVHDIWRGPGHKKHLHLLDNDFFGQPEDQWRARLDEIRDGKFKVCLNQGINIRMITDVAAEALASIEYRNQEFDARRLYTAWDNIGDEKVFFRGIDTLERHGIPAKHVMAYMLIGYDKRETWERIHYRFDRMVERGVMPFPMVFDNTRRDHKDFQRWAITGLYRAIPFSEYNVNAKPKIKGMDSLFANDNSMEVTHAAA